MKFSGLCCFFNSSLNTNLSQICVFSCPLNCSLSVLSHNVDHRLFVHLVEQPWLLFPWIIHKSGQLGAGVDWQVSAWVVNEFPQSSHVRKQKPSSPVYAGGVGNGAPREVSTIRWDRSCRSGCIGGINGFMKRRRKEEEEERGRKTEEENKEEGAAADKNASFSLCSALHHGMM